MKRDFGNRWVRFWNGGVILNDGEYQALSLLIEALPPHLRAIAVKQMEAIDFVQREADGRALNFYRRRGRSNEPPFDQPCFKHSGDDVVLIRGQFSLGQDFVRVHGVISLVRGRLFCLTLSAPIPTQFTAKDIVLVQVTESWRSTIQPDQD